jgi:hypothetical protein
LRKEVAIYFCKLYEINNGYLGEEDHFVYDIVKKYNSDFSIKSNFSLSSPSQYSPYGWFPLNDSFLGCNGHHIWLENRSDFIINIPEFLHRLHGHNHEKPLTMISPNAIALDFWINEDMYYELYELNQTSTSSVYENYDTTVTLDSYDNYSTTEQVAMES